MKHIRHTHTHAHALTTKHKNQISFIKTRALSSAAAAAFSLRFSSASILDFLEDAFFGAFIDQFYRLHCKWGAMRSEVKESSKFSEDMTQKRTNSIWRANSISFIFATLPPHSPLPPLGLRACVCLQNALYHSICAEYWNIICILHIAGFHSSLSLALFRLFAPQFSFGSFCHRQNSIDSCICHLLKFRQITWQSQCNANWIYRLL